MFALLNKPCLEDIIFALVCLRTCAILDLYFSVNWITLTVISWRGNHLDGIVDHFYWGPFLHWPQKQTSPAKMATDNRSISIHYKRQVNASGKGGDLSIFLTNFHIRVAGVSKCLTPMKLGFPVESTSLAFQTINSMFLFQSIERIFNVM